MFTTTVVEKKELSHARKSLFGLIKRPHPKIPISERSFSTSKQSTIFVKIQKRSSSVVKRNEIKDKDNKLLPINNLSFMLIPENNKNLSHTNYNQTKSKFYISRFN